MNQNDDSWMGHGASEDCSVLVFRLEIEILKLQVKVPFITGPEERNRV